MDAVQELDSPEANGFWANDNWVGKGFSWVETPLFESMLAVRGVAEEAEAQVPAQGDDVQEHVAEEVAANVIPATPTSPSPSSPVISYSPPHQPPCPPQPQDAAGSSLLFQRVLDTCSALARRVEGLEHDKAAQQLEIVKLKARVKKLERINKVKSSKVRRLKKVGTSQRVESSDDVENVFNQGRMIVDMDQDKRIELAEIYNIDLDHSSKVLSMQEDDTKVQEAVEVVTTVKLMTEVVTAAATQVAAASTSIPAAKPKTLTITTAHVVSTRRRKGVVIRDAEEELSSDTPAETPKVKDKGKEILIEALKSMKKKDQIEMDAEHARKLQEEINKEHEESYKNIDWNAALNHVQSKEPQYIKRYHGMKKKPQTESKARKNMMLYLRNTKGYKMEFFKGLKYDEILPIFQAKFDANMSFLFKTREEMEAEDEEIIKSINETPSQKAAKRRKLHEQAKEDKDLKKQLEVVVDEDYDVFIKATPIGRKVPVVDYEIVMINNKPRFSTSKPTNFSDDYLLSTLKTMFEKTDGQDAIWRNQQSVYGQALVKSWKLLTSCGRARNVAMRGGEGIKLFQCTKGVTKGCLWPRVYKEVTSRCENTLVAKFSYSRDQGVIAAARKGGQGGDHAILVAKEGDYGAYKLLDNIRVRLWSALVELGASVSVIPLSTYLNLGFGGLAHSNLTVELADKTLKYPKGIAKNMLVGIGKFVFLVNFIIIDMPEDNKVVLILGRTFLSTARAKIDVFKRKITFRIREERIIFRSVKPASSLIKKVYMLSLRERMELDLEAKFMGETLVINRLLDPLNGDYIKLNDLNESFEVRRNQGDDLMPAIKEGEVIEEFRTRDDELDTGIDVYLSFYDYDTKIHIDCAYTLKFSCMIGFEFTHVNFFPLLSVNECAYFCWNLFVVTDFAVLEDMDAYRDEGMGDVIFGKPFRREVRIKARRFEGMITIYKVLDGKWDNIVVFDGKWDNIAVLDGKGIMK
nr:hypothetical protein [Tanacetum cinerariifolium]